MRTSGRARRAMRWRQRAVYLLVLMMTATVLPAQALAAGDGIDVPDPEDWGAPAALMAIQRDEGEALSDPLVISAATEVIDGVQGRNVMRLPATTEFTLRGTPPPPIVEPEALHFVRSGTNGSLPGALQLILDQPLKFGVHIRSGDHVSWVEVLLRPSVEFSWEGLRLRFINRQGWEYVDVDHDTTTGDINGDDLRLRMWPVLEYRNMTITPMPPEIELQLRGGIAIELERVGTGAEASPLDVTFLKSFRYSGINYTWFIEYVVDHLPERSYMSLTADNANFTIGPGQLLQRFLQRINGSVENMTLGAFAGPYTILHETTEDYGYFRASLGYLKVLQSPLEEPYLAESSWLTLAMAPPRDSPVIPRRFSLWLDSPGFNKTFDHLNFTADTPSRLGLEYVDTRENHTQARIIIEEAPSNLRLKIDVETGGEMGRVSYVHYRASAPVDLVRFDEWDFVEGDRNRYLHTHVELDDLPTELWLNGTMEIGGRDYQYLPPDPRAGSFIPQLMDTLMVSLASKLFNIGQTLRTLPSSLLDMPDRKGYINVEFPDPRARLGKIELWLTSSHYASVEPGVDYFAFYNDSVRPVGKMVQTAFSARLLNLRHLHANFVDRKHVVFDSDYNRELRALFIDPKNEANASILFSNVPHNISLELLEDELVYQGEGSVDRIQYLSEIGEQYLRLVLDGVPGGLHLNLGATATGISVLVGEIDALWVQATRGQVRDMEGDHILLEIQPDGLPTASARISGLSSLVVHRHDVNQVSLRSGGGPFKVLVSDPREDFELRAQLDPLPGELNVELNDVLGLGEVDFPSLGDVTSVLDFASVIYSISDVANDVLATIADATAELTGSLGGLGTNVSFSWDGDSNVDLVASVEKGGSSTVAEASWVHGAWVNMAPDGDDVVMSMRTYLTGLAPRGSIEVTSASGDTVMDLEMRGFEPRHDSLYLVSDGSSLLPDGGRRDAWIFLGGLSGRLDLDLSLDLSTDLDVGGSSKGTLALEASQGLGPLHVRTRVRGDQVSTLEVLASSLPARSELSFEYAEAITVQGELGQPVELLFLKLSRKLSDGMAPTATVVLHDVPPIISLELVPGAEFDMDDTNPLANLPRLTLGTNQPGLDMLVDVEGPALGAKADIHLDVRDAEGLTMTLADEELRMSATGLGFAHLQVSKVPYSDRVRINRLDLAVEDLRSIALTVHMVFGVYPLFDLRELRAGGLQLSLDAQVTSGGSERGASISIIEVPTSLSSLPRSHRNGVAMLRTDGEPRLLVPAPVGTLMGTLLRG